jgi:hypothetical protein
MKINLIVDIGGPRGALALADKLRDLAETSGGTVAALDVAESGESDDTPKLILDELREQTRLMSDIWRCVAVDGVMPAGIE